MYHTYTPTAALPSEAAFGPDLVRSGLRTGSLFVRTGCPSCQSRQKIGSGNPSQSPNGSRASGTLHRLVPRSCRRRVNCLLLSGRPPGRFMRASEYPRAIPEPRVCVCVSNNGLHKPANSQPDCLFISSTCLEGNIRIGRSAFGWCPRDASS